MKIVIFLVLTAVLGIASSDMICMQFKLSKCFAVHSNHTLDNAVCASNNKVTECIRTAARECGVESSPVVGEILAKQTETCEEGTEMNDLYKKHRACVFVEAEQGTFLCIEPLLLRLIALGVPNQTRKYKESAMKVACKYADSANTCINNNIIATCGAEAAKFRQHLSDPSVRLSHQACEEVEAQTSGTDYALYQHDEHAVHVMAPHTQHLSATGSQAGSIQIASTVVPRYDEPKSCAKVIDVSTQLIYVFVASIFMKWFSSY